MRIHLSYAAAICMLTTAAATADDRLDMCDFKPVMQENFQNFLVAARTLGSARWTAHTPWNGDFGDARFTDPGPAGPFAVVDGELRITASRDADGHWRSGLIAAADGTGEGTGVQNGYFEARMRFPPGPGVWPAFWLATLKPASDKSPGVEIDAVEYYGHSNAAFSSALHVWYGGADKAQSRHAVHSMPVASSALVNGFHDYGVRVASDQITYYLDGQPIWRQPTPPELTRPLFPMVDLALGSGFSIEHTPNPSTLAVKFVHVFAFDPGGRKGRCSG